jgi:predicted ferric reductase
MGRTAILLAFAVVGYVLGIVVYYIFKNLATWFSPLLSYLAQADWIIAGFVGAIFSVLLVILWSYTTKNS